MSKVMVGMSGGVDSAVAAYLLKQQGYEVTGVMLRTWISDDGQEGRCCEIDDARSVAAMLDIPFHALNCTLDFQARVIDPFLKDYTEGLTPNPCILCNRYVKWEKLMHMARMLEADYVATGHYARMCRLQNGRYTVQRAAHQEKDQTYMLYALTQEQLGATLLPLGGLSKEEVRRIASDIGIPVASKRDSQEICFVMDGDYARYIEENAPGPVPGEGDFVDEEGRVLGRHKGIIHYTVGQRKGLGIALGYPVYVKSIDASTNRVVLGSEESLSMRTVFCRDVNFMGIPPMDEGEEISCIVKIRYHHRGQAARITGLGGARIRIDFEEGARAACPGQSAVFYDAEGCVLGGGVICAGQ